MKKMILVIAFVLMLSSVSAPKSIAFDESHNLFKIEKAFPTLVYSLKAEGYNLDYSDSLNLNSDVLVLIMPSDEFTRSERKQIVEYVKKGGGLLVVCEWGLYANYKHILTASNSISQEFGVTFQKNLVYDPENSSPNDEIWATITNMRRHPITDGITSFLYPSGDSMVLSDRGGRIAWGSLYAWGETDLWGDTYFDYPYAEEYPFISMNPKDYMKKDKVKQSPAYMNPDYGELKYDDLIVLAALQYGKGKIVFIGDSDVFTQTNPENIRLIKNIFKWLSV